MKHDYGPCIHGVDYRDYCVFCAHEKPKISEQIDKIVIQNKWLINRQTAADQLVIDLTRSGKRYVKDETNWTFEKFVDAMQQTQRPFKLTVDPCLYMAIRYVLNGIDFLPTVAMRPFCRLAGVPIGVDFPCIMGIPVVVLDQIQALEKSVMYFSNKSNIDYAKIVSIEDPDIALEVESRTKIEQAKRYWGCIEVDD